MKSNKVQIFGILNITPDSFSDGGLFNDPIKAVMQAEKLFHEGSDFIDVGGESTRPNVKEISWQQEWERVEKTLQILIPRFPSQISLDTKNWRTAKKFLALRGKVLNDVSGFWDMKMIEVAACFQPLVIINHFPGRTTEEVHTQSIDSIAQVHDELLAKKELLIKAGIPSEKIVLDPGIGFGKTMELNWKLLEFAKYVPKEKVLIGHSKKRFLGERRFEAEPNLKAAKIATDAGAWGLRVHEISEQ